MNKVNIYTKGGQREINPDWFTGKTHMKDISKVLEISEQNMYHVHFKHGSKTKLHQHNGNQILIATQGQGSLEIFKKQNAKNGTSVKSFPITIKKTQKIPLKEGDVVYIPAKTLHTHGSYNENKKFSHIAINILPQKNSEYKTVWYESDFKNTIYSIIK